MRAYYRDSSTCDLSLPHDTGRPVSEENLRTLGLKFWKLTGSDDDLEENFRAIGEEMGFIEGSRQRSLQDFAKIEPKAIETEVKFFAQDVLLLTDVLSFIKKGNVYYDIKDAHTNDYIRILVGPGEIYFGPQGSIIQAYPIADVDLGTFCVDELYKTSEPLDKQPPFIQGQDLRSNPLRIAYLTSIGVA
ncbi:1,2-dihydroxy-3-keto-5-methylthiopentene dioxygenase [Marasmius sp. AFHP31]|nr:1,2-dihydroxy-3-keto-5-methylthiopentene dioxygenase [Marasmius sp. AFHP31]